MVCEECRAENIRVSRGDGFICYECSKWNPGFEDEDDEAGDDDIDAGYDSNWPI